MTDDNEQHEALDEILLDLAEATDNSDIIEFASKQGPGGIKPKNTNEEEFGVGFSLPFGSWLNTQNELEATNRQIVPIENLIEMRKKDGQARALYRLLSLPIWRAAADGEWIAPDEQEAPEEQDDQDTSVDPGKAEEPAKAPTDREKDAAKAGKIPPVPADPENPDVPLTEENAVTDRERDQLAKEKEKPVPGDAEATFMNQMWTLPKHGGGMSVTWSRVIRQITLAIPDGCAPFEEVRTVPKEGPLKGKIILKKLAYRDPRTLRFLVDDKGGFDGARQKTVVNGRTIDVKIPADKMWYYAANEEENPYYGVSWLEPAFFHYDVKRKLYYIAHIAAQMSAVPGRVGKMPEAGGRNIDLKRLEAVRKAIKDFAFNHSLILPPGWDLVPFSSSTGFNFLELVNHHNSMMSKSVLAKFLDDESRSVVIDNSNSSPDADFFVMALEALMAEIAESLSHFVAPKYIDWNFGSGLYPTYKFGTLADSTKDAIKELFQVVATAQSSLWTPEFIRQLEMKLTDRLGLEVDYDEVEKREQEEEAELEEQKRQEMALYQQQFDQQQEEPPPAAGPFDTP